MQNHIIDALAASGADASGFRLRCPNEEDHTAAMGRVVKDLIFSCSDFPYLDAEKQLRKYKELIATSPFVLMAGSVPEVEVVQEEVLPPQNVFAPPPPPPLTFVAPPPVVTVEEPRQVEQAAPPSPPRPLVAPPSLVTAAPTLSIQVAFPVDSNLTLQSFRIPGDSTIQQAMDQIRQETGGVLSENASLCVDPMARHVGAFANAPSFPYFENSATLNFYKEAVTRNVLYWRNAKIQDQGRKASADVSDTHPNDYLLKGGETRILFIF